MKIWPLAVLIFALLSQHSSQSAKQVQQQPDSGQKVSNPPAAVPVLPSAPKTSDSESASKKNADTQQPVRIAQPIAITTKPDYATWFFSALLVGVGAFQAWLLLGTMRAIQTQAGIMRGQLTKMEESLKVTQDSVGFAKRNLEVFINEKRVRIFVELQPLDLESAPTFGNWYMVKYTATCHGQTFAFVDDAGAEVKVTDSAEPPELPYLVRGRIDLPKAIPPATEPKEGVLIIWDNIDDFIRASINHGKSFVHCRGIVKHKDFVGEERETAFCYRWKPRAPLPAIGGGYWEKVGSPEANRET